MSQLALDIDYTPHRLARASDPITSKEAAQRVKEFAPTHCEKVLTCLLAYGPLTPEDIEAQIGIEAYAVRKRLSDLFNHEPRLAAPTGELAPTRKGRRQRIWRAI